MNFSVMRVHKIVLFGYKKYDSVILTFLTEPVSWTSQCHTLTEVYFTPTQKDLVLRLAPLEIEPPTQYE